MFHTQTITLPPLPSPHRPPVRDKAEMKKLQNVKINRILRAAAYKKPTSLCADFVKTTPVIAFHDPGLEKLDRLETLSLVNQGLVELDSEFLKKLTNVTALDLSENRLEFPMFGRMPALRELRMQCNLIADISVPAFSYETLKSLDLSFNMLGGDCLTELAKLPLLTDLDVSHNDLGFLPADLSAFKHLLSLKLQRTSLETVECLLSLNSIPGLKYLDVSDNQLVSLPEELSFPALTSFIAANNFLEFKDDLAAIARLEGLLLLDLSNCPIADKPDDITDLQAILFGCEVMTSRVPLPPIRWTTKAKLELQAEQRRQAALTHTPLAWSKTGSAFSGSKPSSRTLDSRPELLQDDEDDEGEGLSEGETHAEEDDKFFITQERGAARPTLNSKANGSGRRSRRRAAHCSDLEMVLQPHEEDEEDKATDEQAAQMMWDPAAVAALLQRVDVKTKVLAKNISALAAEGVDANMTSQTAFVLLKNALKRQVTYHKTSVLSAAAIPSFQKRTIAQATHSKPQKKPAATQAAFKPSGRVHSTQASPSDLQVMLGSLSSRLANVEAQLGVVLKNDAADASLLKLVAEAYRTRA
eukprot:gnl/Hemi2/19852_TR6588_c0_g2_i1.p1 gnl/Hemi2/19852_TR6588_c0_g2~~gnl/Hemi2/19852_TR6588_c0_g2_i1.p1  ORF type:complete len:585 (-),score=203.41 gnl/Hemi2/19852_TR6588_c0_g2_i1:88-1842(-)